MSDDDGVASIFEPEEEEAAEVAEIASEGEETEVAALHSHGAHTPGIHNPGYSMHNANELTGPEWLRFTSTLHHRAFGIHVLDASYQAERHRLISYDDESALPLAKRDKAVVINKMAGAIMTLIIGTPCLALLVFLFYMWASS